MANDTSSLSLVLSDIMHTMSPSPVTRRSPEEPMAVPERDLSPEPLTAEDVDRMRGRIRDMGFGSTSNEQFSSREKELVDMVLRLSTTFIDPSQLAQQGEVISSLISQRDYLVQQALEERERFDSEKDGWGRMAEALIAQRHGPGSSGTKEQELERQCSSVQADNRNLRAKLLDTQNRLSSLESELKHLKPLLLLNTAPSSSPRQSSKSEGKKAQRDNDSMGTHAIDDGVSMASPTRQPSQASLSEGQASSSQEYQCPSASSTEPLPRTVHTVLQHEIARQRSLLGPNVAGPPSQQPSGPSNSKKLSKYPKVGRKGAFGSLLPLSSDARTEHILLAARRIGRERATAVAGVMRAAEQEKERMLREQEAARITKETERLERERLERLASGQAGMGYYRRETAETAKSNVPSSSGRQGHSGQLSSSMPQRVSMSHYPPSVAGINPPATGSSLMFVENASGSANYTSQGVAGPPTPGNTATNQRDRRAEPAHHHQRQDSQNPSTPLASLLSAASMLDDGSNGTCNTRASSPSGNGTSRGRRKSSAMEQPEILMPKRRRVVSSSGIKPVTRVRSALDVLADQAAAAFTSEADHVNGGHESTPSISTKKPPAPTTTRAKSKGKAKEPDSTSSRKVTVPNPVVTQEDNLAPTNGKGHATRTAALKAKGKAKANVLSSSVSSSAAAVRKPRPPPRDRSAISAASASKDAGEDSGRAPTPAGGGPRMISPPGHRLIAAAGPSSGTINVQQSGMPAIADALSPVVVQSNDADDSDKHHPRANRQGTELLNMGESLCGDNEGMQSGSFTIPTEATTSRHSDDTQTYDFPHGENFKDNRQVLTDAHIDILHETRLSINNLSPSVTLPILDPDSSLSRSILNGYVDNSEDTSNDVPKLPHEFESVRPESSMSANPSSSLSPGAQGLLVSNQLPSFSYSVSKTYERKSSPIVTDERISAPKVHELDGRDIGADVDEDMDAEGEDDDEITYEGEIELNREVIPQDVDSLPSHSSPLPPTGNDGDSQLVIDDHDIDADAEGEEDVEADESSQQVGSDVTQSVSLGGQPVSLGLAQDLKPVMSFSALCQ